MTVKAELNRLAFNQDIELPFDLRISDFRSAMEDVYDFFHDVNKLLSERGLQRLDDMMRPAAMSGTISDMITASLAKFSRALVENKHFNGHPDLIKRGKYANNSVAAGTDGIEIKSTRKKGARSTRTEQGINGCAFSCIRSTIAVNLHRIGAPCNLLKSTWRTLWKRIFVATQDRNSGPGLPRFTKTA